jgi:hypothetical protein
MPGPELTPPQYTPAANLIWPPPPEAIPGEGTGSVGYMPTDIRAFDNQNCWVLLLLLIVTVGLYQIYWMIKTAKVVNRILPDRSIPLLFFWTLIGLLVVNVIAELIAATLRVLYPNSGQSVEDVRRLFGFGVGIYNLVLLFRVKAAMNHVLWRTFPRSERFSGIGTFFFGSLCLQIQLNKYIRQEAKREPAARSS